MTAARNQQPREPLQKIRPVSPMLSMGLFGLALAIHFITADMPVFASIRNLAYFFGVAAMYQFLFFRMDLAPMNWVGVVTGGCMGVGCASGCSCLGIVVLPTVCWISRSTFIQWGVAR
ncbi:MAG: hypothetical protein AAFP90_00165 [Planctomycetota bacterium]